jgi:hypothetical protein
VERRALLALALAALLAACGSEESPSCPGAPVGRFSFSATLAAEVEAGFDPDPSLTACAFDPGFPGALRFGGTLARNPESSSAALCRNDVVFFGTRAGERWDVEISSDGAVLPSCGATCLARSRSFVKGLAGPDPEAPTEFGGALVEQLTASAGDCGRCVLPCAGRYTLSGVSEGSP